MQRTSVNKVILVGRLGKNPEGRYTASGRSTAYFSLATDESWIDNNKQKHEITEWHNVLSWDKTADFVTQFLKKGQLVYVEGKIRSSNWVDKDGVSRKKFDILSNQIVPLEWKKD